MIFFVTFLTLIHYSPVLLFYTLRFSDVFRGYKKATPGCNGLIQSFGTHLSVPLTKNYKIYRSSHLRIFYKKGVLKNFTNLTGNQLCCRLFLAKLQAFRLRLQHICFPATFAKFIRTPILKNIYERLLLNLPHYL